jgi:hypothetical protein
MVVMGESRDLSLDRYEAMNLLALIEATVSNGPTPMDTGDWHGQIHWKLEALLKDWPRDYAYPELPNQTPEQMQERAIRAALGRNPNG